MDSLRVAVVLLAVGLGTSSARAQSVAGNAWSSFGVLPFRGYDFVIAKAPTRYIAYYTRHSATDVDESAADVLGRAFSTDLKNWTVDTGDICATSGELCRLGHTRAGVLTLPDGRLRMFVNSGGGLSSMLSADGVTWTLEPGVRFQQDTSSIYERGNFALQLASFVPLADGSVRMYYEGGVVNGSPGTPAYYNSMFVNGVILSATSKDNGLTWTRDPGVRINPLVQGPAVSLTVADGSKQNQFGGADVTAVAVTENGRTVFRIYAPTLTDGAASYVSEDGLNFALEGIAPTAGGDPKAVVMQDGRIWLVSNQYPDAIDDALVYGPQSLMVSSVKAGVAPLPGSGFASPFQSVLMGVTGTTSGTVSLEAASDDGAGCPALPCSFHPEYYSFSPASGTPPFTTVVSYTGPAGYSANKLFVHAKSAGTTAVGAISCMTQVLGRADTDVFCKTTETALPMNRMRFAFSSGAAPSSQVSNLLSLGGSGYPFTVSSSVPWAAVSPAGGTAPLPITVTVDPTRLAEGSYSGIVTISAAGTTEQIAVSAVVSAAAPVILDVRNAGSSSATIAPNSFVTIYGSGFATSPVTWSRTTSLPIALGGVSVQVNGKDAYISYADSGQLNVLTPPDTATGRVMVRVTTPAGSATADATMAAVAPAWFTYTVGQATWIAALFANTATYVAPSGSLGVQSRAAKAGDYLQLYANGLGATNPTAPAGVVWNGAYPIDDLSRVKVSIAGRPVAVLFAGLVYPGLYQINVQVPAGLGVGELPIVMAVDGQITQGATLNIQ